MIFDYFSLRQFHFDSFIYLFIYLFLGGCDAFVKERKKERNKERKKDSKKEGSFIKFSLSTTITIGVLWHIKLCGLSNDKP